MDWRALLRNKRVLAVAGVGGALGLGVAVARRRKAGAGGPAGDSAGNVTSGPYVPMTPSVYDSSLQDIWEGVNAVGADLQQQIQAIQDQLGQNTPPSPATPPPSPPATPPPSPPAGGLSPAWKAANAWFLWPTKWTTRKAGSTLYGYTIPTSISGLAQHYGGSSALSREQWTYAFYRLNPSLAGRTSFAQGTTYTLPKGA